MGMDWVPPPNHTPYTGIKLPNTHTPSVDADYLRKETLNHPNTVFIQHVLRNSIEGARLGFTCPVEEVAPRLRQANNLSSTKLHPHIIEKFIKEETETKRWAGPFDSPPHPNAQVIPLGLAKKGDHPMSETARIITHCSKKWDDGVSLNDLIPDAAASVSYVKWVNVLDDVRDLEKEAGKQGEVWATTTDVKFAFRNIKIHDEHLHLLVYAWPDKDGVTKYYVEQVLSFGARANPRTFDALASAIHYILDLKMKEAGLNVRINHLLDDLIICGVDKTTTIAAYKIMGDVLTLTGLPLHPGKTIPPTQQLTYLGGVFNFKDRTIEMPVIKRQILIRDLEEIFNKPEKKLLVTTLHSIVGKLGWQGAVIAITPPKNQVIF